MSRALTFQHKIYADEVPENMSHYECYEKSIDKLLNDLKSLSGVAAWHNADYHFINEKCPENSYYWTNVTIDKFDRKTTWKKVYEEIEKIKKPETYRWI